MQPTPILRALDIARWAPSGDNGQAWRFIITDELSAGIRVRHHADNPYEYNHGEAVLVSLGALLESLRIGASAEGYVLEWDYEGYTEPHFHVTVRLVPAETTPDPLLPYVPTRSVNRKPMKTTPLSAADKETLAASLGDTLRVTWHEGRKDKWASTRLSILATDLRLRMKASFLVLARVLEWNSPTSETKMPVATLPVSALTRTLMRWAFGSWARMRFMVRYMGGAIAPIIETDLIPNMRCAAHFTLAATQPQRDERATIRHGMALQRFWLTATTLGLTMQPLYSTLMFAYYGTHQSDFIDTPRIREGTISFAPKVRLFMEQRGIPFENAVFIGRIGYPYPQKIIARSVRMPLEQLIAYA